MQIALIDDEQIWRDSAKYLLERAGATVVAYSDPVELPPDKAAEFDIVICDNKIRNQKRGISYLQSVRAGGFEGRLVLYTNFAREVDHRSAKRIDAVVVDKSKPFKDGMLAVVGLSEADFRP